MADIGHTGPECCDEEIWTSVALGLPVPEPETRSHQQLLAHAATCDTCGPLLRDAVRAFAGEAGPVVVEMPRRRPIPWNWAAVAAAAVVCVVGGLQYIRGTAPPFGTLARAYSSHRTIELRWPEAAHAPLEIERGKAESSEDLLRAELAIRSSPRTPDWLRAKGRFHLLRWETREAIAALTEAADLAEPGADLLSDLGMAYFARAEGAENGASDYTRANEYFSQALRISPKNPAARFNRAVVREKLALFTAALEDWEELLRQEPSGGWAEEARKRRDAVAERIKKVQSREWEIAAAQHVERRMEAALTSGRAVSELRTDADVMAASDKLKSLGDPWLSQLLALGPRSDAAFGLAVEAAKVRTRQGSMPDGLRLSLDRVSESAELPLRAWIEFELLRDAAQTSPAQRCPGRMEKAARAARIGGYRWLEGQIRLETSTCLSALARFEEADRSTMGAVAIASESPLPVLRARAMSFHSSHLIDQGRYREAIGIALRGVGDVYRENLPRARFHNFHNDVYRAAERMERWQTAADGAAMTAEMAAWNEFTGLELLLRAGAAENLARVGDSAKATAQLDRAEALRRENTQTGAREVFALTALAKARGDRNLLAPLDNLINQTANPFWRVPFDVVLAGLDRKAGQRRQAESRLRELLGWLGGRPRESGDSHRWKRDLGDASRLLALTLIEQGEPERALAAWEDYQWHEDRMLGRVGEGPSAVESGVLDVTLVELEGRYAMWTRANGQVEFRWLPTPAPELHRRARVFRRATADPARGEEPVAISLRQEIFAPIATKLSNARALLLRVDGGLDQLPFHALPVGDEPLGTRIAVAYRQGSAIPAILAPAPPGRALVIGAGHVPQDLRAEYPPLPGLAEEVSAIADSLTGARLLRDHDVTREEIERELPGNSIVHFSGHAAAGPDGVSLLLAGGSPGFHFWRVPARIDRSPRLVVLGACATAELEEFDSVAPRHMAHAFLRAGSGQVLATLWNLDHGAARQFFGAFYPAVSRGLSPAEATREAAKELQKSGYRHPYYWAPFALFV